MIRTFLSYIKYMIYICTKQMRLLSTYKYYNLRKVI